MHRRFAPPVATCGRLHAPPGPMILVLVLSLALVLPAAAGYILQGIGPLTGVATQPAAINDLGQVAGIMTGT
jgi:hypothetical protein